MQAHALALKLLLSAVTADQLAGLQSRPGHGRTLDAYVTDAGRKVLARADAITQTLEDRMSAALTHGQRRRSPPAGGSADGSEIDQFRSWSPVRPRE